VPGEDERDWEFAKSTGCLSSRRSTGRRDGGRRLHGDGGKIQLRLSSKDSQSPRPGRRSTAGRAGLGTAKVNYCLRDWGISAQPPELTILGLARRIDIPLLWSAQQRRWDLTIAYAALARIWLLFALLTARFL